MNPFRTGKLVLFQVTYDRDWHFFEIFFFVIIGIFGVLSLLDLLIPALIVPIFTGPLRRIRREIQSTGSCIPTKAPGCVWRHRSCNTRHPHSHVQLLQ